MYKFHSCKIPVICVSTGPIPVTLLKLHDELNIVSFILELKLKMFETY